MTVAELTQAALSLNEEDRYTLLERLRMSLPGSDPAESGANGQIAWQRLQAYLDNPDCVRPWRDALADLKAAHQTAE